MTGRGETLRSLPLRGIPTTFCGRRGRRVTMVEAQKLVLRPARGSAETRLRMDGGREQTAVPEEVVSRAKMAFAQRTNTRVAALTFDSLIDGGDPAQDHLLVFEDGRARIDLQVCAHAASSHLLGRIEPATATRVQLEQQSGAPRLASVADGRFCFKRVRHGVIRLSVLDETASPVLCTDWFSV